jgi:hypothetical protein
VNTTCCICGREITLSVDEFFEVEQDIDNDFFCDECGEYIRIFVVAIELMKN